jgi:isoamylase
VFQRRKFFQGRPIRGTAIKDLSWFGPDGQEMSDEAWGAGYVKCLGVRLAGDEIVDKNDRGEPLVGDTILLLLNAHHEAIPFALPAARPEHHWLLLLDTSKTSNEAVEIDPSKQFELQGRSVAIFRTLATNDTTTPLSSEQVENLRKDALPPAPPSDKALLV